VKAQVSDLSLHASFVLLYQRWSSSTSPPNTTQRWSARRPECSSRSCSFASTSRVSACGASTRPADRSHIDATATGHPRQIACQAEEIVSSRLQAFSQLARLLPGW